VAIAVVVAFMATANVVNVVLFEVDVLGPMNIWNALGIAINLVVIGAKRRVIQGVATILFGVWLSLYIWMFVPVTY